MNKSQQIKLSKFLSLILRHKPHSVGIELDKKGWAETKSLLKGLKRKGFILGLEDLKEVVKTDNKQRYIFSEDYSKIRANQGHSLDVDLDLVQTEPPEFLFHGTTKKNINSIKERGIVRGTRQYVHLSENRETADDVGKRYGKPHILIIKAKEMYSAGFKFYLSENQVWLCDHVEPQFIIF